jgi:NAD-dependent SIR2 family protein deacetylase
VLPGPHHALAALLVAGGVVVLSGAGLSTESGIPDYRGPTGTRRRSQPMTYAEFVSDPHARQRYWARSHVGWRTIARATPNAGHRAVATLQQQRVVGGIITQNVDGLHQKAGAGDVVDLHGTLDRVRCLDCGDLSAREWLDVRLHEANPGWEAQVTRVNADGDVELDDAAVRDFATVACSHCRTGTLKPDVVFFGESVPRDRVDRCFAMVDEAQTLLVLGSSLTVMSGYRFVRHAARLGVPVVIINQGPTRGDEHATVRLDAPLGATLSTLVDDVTRRSPAAV